MKIKQHLVIFLIIVLLNMVYFTNSNVTEKANLIKNYLKDYKTKASESSISDIYSSKSYNLKLIVLRDITKPINSIVREYNVNAVIEPQTLTMIKINSKKKKIQKIYWSE